MSEVTVHQICQLGFLTYLFLFSYISVTTSVSLDLTELRNKVAKINVNQRGNLWATGHFMGKKSVLDSPVFDSPDQQSVNSLRAALDRDINVQEMWELITQEVLKIALKAQQQDTRGKLDVNDQETGLFMKILEKYIQNT
ncbi:bombesin-like [Acipenser oxyrinchus oxyrinchus]|uniref:Bombesin-like n=1 Tax=Acipenser oxyrinchus oxyrinchus TaxID=40147 RepID=A0AAD8G1H5_ACIOX|nr:bombesin-like [Acipenser oxyrinchus oxyrinchus]